MRLSLMGMMAAAAIAAPAIAGTTPAGASARREAHAKLSPVQRYVDLNSASGRDEVINKLISQWQQQGLDAEARQHFVCYEDCDPALKRLLHANLTSLLERVEDELSSSS